jgi:myo-inositol-1(or 4)-monophosphatase
LPAHDLTLLTDAARAAGRIAATYWTKNPQTWDKPDGHGPVTEADLEIDRMLKAELLAARPDYGWLSEETEDSAARLGKTRVFIVDPIDGTRSFIEGNRAFAHSLAVAQAGRIVAGVVFLPMMDRMFTAALGQGAHLNGGRLTASRLGDEPGTQILASRPNYNADHWPGGVPLAERTYRPSLAYRMALVGEGRFDGMVTFRDSWEWDIAAGALIATEAGAEVTDRDGAPLVFNNPTPLLPGVITAGAPLHTALMARRRPA